MRILAFSAESTNQFQNLVVGSIPRNYKFCVNNPKGECIGQRCTSNLNLQKEVNTVGSLEEPVHQTPTYNSIYRGSNGPWTERIHKRQIISEKEKVGVFIRIINLEFSLPIQLGSQKTSKSTKYQGENRMSVKRRNE